MNDDSILVTTIDQLKNTVRILVEDNATKIVIEINADGTFTVTATFAD